MIESMMIYVWDRWVTDPWINKELASKLQEHQMEGSMHMEDGCMHRRMQKNKHMQGKDLDTPTTLSNAIAYIRMLPNELLSEYVLEGTG